MFGNRYYKITKPTQIWVKTGSVPGNSYYGASRIYDVTGVELTTRVGEEFHDLVGGLFIVREDGIVYEVLHKKPADLNMHFCKDYTPKRWYQDKIIAASEPVEINNPRQVSYR
jgi:hypothetical protein